MYLHQSCADTRPSWGAAASDAVAASRPAPARRATRHRPDPGRAAFPADSTLPEDSDEIGIASSQSALKLQILQMISDLQTKSSNPEQVPVGMAATQNASARDGPDLRATGTVRKHSYFEGPVEFGGDGASGEPRTELCYGDLITLKFKTLPTGEKAEKTEPTGQNFVACSSAAISAKHKQGAEHPQVGYHGGCKGFYLMDLEPAGPRAPG